MCSKRFVDGATIFDESRRIWANEGFGEQHKLKSYERSRKQC